MLHAIFHLLKPTPMPMFFASGDDDEEYNTALRTFKQNEHHTKPLIK